MQLIQFPGWRGLHTTNQARNALLNGTTIRKINSEPRDQHQDGAKGRILGSIWHEAGLGYFVEWEDKPKVAVFVDACRIKPL